MKKIKTVVLLSFVFLSTSVLYGQSQIGSTGGLLGQSDGDRLNTITTAVPFLIIAPDTRAGAMGDAGVSTSPDANSIHWNPAKLAFVEKNVGFSLSYTPWLRKLVPDISLSYISFYKKLDKLSGFGASLRYFTLGDIQFTNDVGENTIQFRPNEFAIDLAYGRKLAKNLSGGLAVRYVNSNLTGGQSVSQADTKPGMAVAADVSAYYQNDKIKLKDKKAVFAAGLNISNIGNKMSYSNTNNRDFIPINLRLGPRFTVKLDDYNSFSLTADINRLLVPTPAIYDLSTNVSEEGKYTVIAGKDPERSVASGMFGSFSDAPGNPVRDENGDFIYKEDGTIEVEKGSVFKEEMREFNIASGMEYWYAEQFSIRAGYFWEHALKGNRKYVTLGAGLRYNVFALDFSYLIPAYFGSSVAQNSPLQNTLRFTLQFDFTALAASADEPKAE